MKLDNVQWSLNFTNLSGQTVNYRRSRVAVADEHGFFGRELQRDEAQFRLRLWLIHFLDAAG